jgi:hypothetical protein
MVERGYARTHKNGARRLSKTRAVELKTAVRSGMLRR